MKNYIKKPRKIVGVLLLLLLVVSNLSVSVMAQEGEKAENLTVTIDTGVSVTLKDNDKDSYYDIGSADELYAFASAVNGGELTINGELTENIVVNEGIMTRDTIDARVWTPIGAVGCKALDYTGNFEGNGKTVSGLYYDNLFVDYVGLFGYSKGIINNVGVINSYLHGSHYVGAVAGKNENKIYGCYSDSTVQGGQNVGGVAGLCKEAEECCNYGTVKGDDFALNLTEDGNIDDSNPYPAGVGGVVGNSDEIVYYCKNYGTVNGRSSSSSVGGIVGYAEQVEDCVNEGNVFGGSMYTGGIAGQYLDIYRCSNYADVSGGYWTGGIGGYGVFMGYGGNSGKVEGHNYVGGAAGECKGIIMISNSNDVEGYEYTGGIAGYCYSHVDFALNSGNVKGTNYTGGLLGYSGNGNIYLSNNIGKSVSGENYVGGIVGCYETDSSYPALYTSYNLADVTGENYVGGLAGSAYGAIKNAYNAGSVVGESYVGSVAGEIDLQKQIEEYPGILTEIDVYYLKASAKNSDGEDMGGVGVYYEHTAENQVAELEEFSYLTEVTAEDFASGKIAYLLQSTQEYEVWGQNIDNNRPLANYPELSSATVYGVGNCVGDVVAYSNTEGKNLGHNFNDSGVCKYCYTLKEGELAGVVGYNLSLADTLEVNYYVAVDESAFEDEEAKVVFTVGEGDKAYTIERPLSEVATGFAARSQSGLYAFTCDVAAKEVTATIKAKLIANGQETEFPEYSVMSYAETILADSENYADAAELVKAMLNYSASAQLYFDYNTEKLANSTEYMTDEERVVNKDIDLSEYEFKLTGEAEGVSYYGSALVLESETAIKNYFVLDETVDVDTLTVTIGGEEAELTKNGNLYAVKIEDIYAHRLGTMYEVKVGDLTLEYGAMSYGYAAMGKGKEALKDTICALYNYYLTAVEYRNK
ncbi:MAG: hypothetical protein E7566_06445 [Ruminococcaceae bacterium]|nr:hypothetical protein [Oscillospiraceae bacterium]